MNPRRYFPIVLIALAFGSEAGAAPKTRARKPPESDIASIETRQAVVELALNLAKVEAPASLADAQLPRPFNPPGFGMASAQEVHPASEATPAGPAKPFGDREILAAIAPLIKPTGTFTMGSDRLLMFSKKKLKAGDRLTVNYEGQDYTLELVNIDRTNFTLRFNHEEITRPIKPGKTP